MKKTKKTVNLHVNFDITFLAGSLVCFEHSTSYNQHSSCYSQQLKKMQMQTQSTHNSYMQSLTRQFRLCFRKKLREPRGRRSNGRSNVHFPSSWIPKAPREGWGSTGSLRTNSRSWRTGWCLDCEASETFGLDFRDSSNRVSGIRSEDLSSRCPFLLAFFIFLGIAVLHIFGEFICISRHLGECGVFSNPPPQECNRRAAYETPDFT